MENQDSIEEKLLLVCPLCGSNDIIEIVVRDENSPIEYLVDSGIFDINISEEWDGRVCRDCSVAWSVCRWACTDFEVGD